MMMGFIGFEGPPNAWWLFAFSVTRRTADQRSRKRNVAEAKRFQKWYAWRDRKQVVEFDARSVQTDERKTWLFFFTPCRFIQMHVQFAPLSAAAGFKGAICLVEQGGCLHYCSYAPLNPSILNVGDSSFPFCQ
jgi:hypothetical protein